MTEATAQMKRGPIPKDEVREKLTVLLPISLKKALAHHKAMDGVTATYAIIKALRKYFEAQRKHNERAKKLRS